MTLNARRNDEEKQFLCVCVCHCVFSVQTLEGCEVLLGPEVTYGPPGLDLCCPVAMTIAHCAEVETDNWNIQLKRKTQDGKWEVRRAGGGCCRGLSLVFLPLRVSGAVFIFTF